jgi:competence protein ComEA
MEQAPATPSVPVTQPSAAAEPALLAAWPHCVQLAVCVLLALGIGFLLGRSYTGNSAPVPVDIDNSQTAERSTPRLDLNRATRSELALLPGLGPAKAQSVDDYRRQHGPFRKLDDLHNVPGIGPKTFDKVRPWLFVGEIALAPMPPNTPRTSASAAPTSKATALTAAINVNTATAAELQKLPGVGPKTAQRILDERALRGPFKTVDELRRVPGIGPKTLEKLRPHIIVDSPVVVAGS